MGEGLMAWMRLEMPHFYSQEAGIWVGKLAYLTTDPMTIQEGKSGHCSSHNKLIKLR